LLKNGEIYLGNNQENRAYPSGMCAERSVLYYIGALGKGTEISKIAVRARCPHAPVLQPITPCGSCRQAMLEYEELSKENIVILMKGESGDVLRVEGVRETLMPFSFDAEF
jgi:cytidine deaminase